MFNGVIIKLCSGATSYICSNTIVAAAYILHMNKANPKVDFYFAKAIKFSEELALMRSLALGCGLTEELKWGVPTYLFEGANIVLIHSFKQYCAFLFFKGALLKDAKQILIQQTKNVQAARQIRFTDKKGINTMQADIKAYILEAIAIEKAGLKVPLKATDAFDMPEAFKKQLHKNPALKTAFKKLTPGRQRAYLLYFAAPKQETTRMARIEKCINAILSGKGLND